MVCSVTVQKIENSICLLSGYSPNDNPAVCRFFGGVSMATFFHFGSTVIIVSLVATLGAQSPETQSVKLSRKAFAERFLVRLAAVPAGAEPCEDAVLIGLVTSHSWHAVPLAVNWLEASGPRQGVSRAARDQHFSRAAVIAGILARAGGKSALSEIASRMKAWKTADWQAYGRARKACAQGAGFIDQGKVEQAAPKFRAAEALYKKLGHRDWQALAEYMCGICLYRLERYNDAVALQEEALRVRETIGNEREIAESLNDLAKGYVALGEHPRALPLAERAQRFCRKIGDPYLTAVVRSTLASALRNLGRSKAALEHQKQALVIFRKLGENENIALSLNNLGNILKGMGRHKEAMEALAEALEIHEKLGGKEGMAYVLENQGSVHEARGEYRLALEDHARALALRQEAGLKKGMTESLTCLGIVHQAMGHLDQALRFHHRALALAREVRIKPAIAASQSNLAYVYFRSGLVKKARNYFEKAVALRRELGIPGETALVLNNLAAACQELGHRKDARKLYEEILGMKEPLPGSTRASALQNLGNVHMEDRLLTRAIDCHQRALELRRRSGNRLEIADSLINLGSLYWLRLKLDKAGACYLEALETYEGAGDDIRAATALACLGDVHDARREPGRALETFARAASCFERAKARVSRIGEDAGFAFARKNTDALPLRAVSAAWKAFQIDGKKAHWATAYTILERYAGASLRLLLAEAVVDPHKGVRPDLLAALEQINTEFVKIRLRLDREMRRPAPLRNRQRLDALRSRRADLDRKEAHIREKIRLLNPRFADLTNARGMSVSQVQDALVGSEVLLSYLLAEKHAFAFVVTAGSLRLVNLGPSRPIRHALGMLVRVLQGKHPDRVPVSAYLKALSRALLHPLESALEGASRLTVMPHGVLSFVPIDALETTRGKRVVELWPVSYVHSGTVLARLRQRRKAGARNKPGRVFFGLGDPVYDDGSSSRRTAVVLRDEPLARLRGSGQEVCTIAALLTDDKGPVPDEARSVKIDRGPVAVFTGVYATEAVLKRPSFLSSFRAVHLACHGRVDHERPGLSGLFLSRPVGLDALDDGHLRLREVFDMRLNAEVAVLSACDSNAGKADTLEGIRCLTRGFLYAGAAAVISSNWKAPDDTTRVLMEAFYQSWLLEGRKPVEALQCAKLKVRADHPHPFLWAGFVLWGLGE